MVQVYKSDISDLHSELEAMRKALDRERIRGGELEAKLASLDQDMAFQLQVGRTFPLFKGFSNFCENKIALKSFKEYRG